MPDELAPGKPIIVAEFGCDNSSPQIKAAEWARAALEDLFSERWPAIIAFSWWNESWENDDDPAHNSDLIIRHDEALIAAYRDELEKHRDRIEEKPRLEQKR